MGNNLEAEWKMDSSDDDSSDEKVQEISSSSEEEVEKKKLPTSASLEFSKISQYVEKNSDFISYYTCKSDILALGRLVTREVFVSIKIVEFFRSKYAFFL
jgi:hypothetical protein